MIANFEQTVEDAKESNQELGTAVTEAGTAMTEMPEWMKSQATPIGQPTPPTEPPAQPTGDIQELIDILTSGEAIVQLKEAFG